MNNINKIFCFTVLFILVIVGHGLRCYEDKLSDEGGYEERDCEESSEFCAKLINDNTEQTPEIYRACAPPKMCSEEGHFTLVYHTGLHFHCCRGDNCNDASSTSIGISLLSVFYSLYLLL